MLVAVVGAYLFMYFTFKVKKMGAISAGAFMGQHRKPYGIYPNSSHCYLEAYRIAAVNRQYHPGYITRFIGREVYHGVADI